MDYYSILGVSKTANQDEIKKAYRKLAMQSHPDRNGGDDTKFKKINEAYDTLKDPNKRQQYDNPQPRFDTSSFNQNFGNFDDIFSQMFRSDVRRPRRPMNADITIGADIYLKDVFTGKSLIVNYRLASGKQETVTIEIPPGAKHGDAVRYEGLGDDANPRMPRGNLIVKMRERKDAEWARDGNNIIKNQQVNMFDLLTGCVIIVKTPENRNVRISIPKGTQPGKILSVSEYGIPDLRTGRRGNLFVRIEAHIPTVNRQDLIDKIVELRNEISTST